MRDGEQRNPARPAVKSGTSSSEIWDAQRWNLAKRAGSICQTRVSGEGAVRGEEAGGLGASGVTIIQGKRGNGLIHRTKPGSTEKRGEPALAKRSPVRKLRP
ncbi:hypothetical protein Pla22_31410 [Rubripirellula amarantea]|uniref:Uncharacterized protein n=1 Tax=Rubripirellula amarantea TaxID=2527999 RepID=A0A5C5WJT5_9BACT|nr:hypothetical protein Pla22_31410 [Rubripirellula amarantea]